MRLTIVGTCWALFTAVATAQEKAAYPPLPEAFSSFGAAVSAGHVYVYGGHVARTHTYSTEAVTGKFRRLNIANPAKGWEELPASIGLQGLALVAHGSKLYRIGGMRPLNKPGEPTNNVSVASCEVFDPKSHRWSALPDLPQPRSSHDAIAVGDKIFVVGGWTMNGTGKKSIWADTALVLDLAKAAAQWQEIKQPFQRRALNITGLNGKLYVVGGLTPDAGTETLVDIYDTATGKWSQGPPLPGSSRNGFSPAVCTAADAVFANPADGKVYRLDSKEKAWREVGKVEQPRIVHRLVPAGNGSLLVLGGASRAGNVARTEVVDSTGH